MKVTLWGTRGSLASPGKDTARYGGNTSCVEVVGDAGTVVILDAGTGLRGLGLSLPRSLRRVNLLLTHLHMDHIQGLGFFGALRNPEIEVHIWGPASTTLDLRSRLTRYLSPPLFPVHLRELPNTILHEVPCEDFEIEEFRISTALVCHPDPTVGYRIESGDAVITYLPDHEPALGAKKFPLSPDWTSGYELAAGSDILIHDAQFTDDEYKTRVGWGHSSLTHAFEFAELAGVKSFVPFHHDPSHTDDVLDDLINNSIGLAQPDFSVMPGVEGATFEPS
ncbi:MAG TPA: MBL fold metallo-hydrolase [Anaerolineales bacterium]|jgi:phosphoribosyl 1,2-cyclic phosphodiesterase|nr:MBL fold metallo-hydrolase [Anaerolineales bacterium]